MCVGGGGYDIRTKRAPSPVPETVIGSGTNAVFKVLGGRINQVGAMYFFRTF